MGVGFRGEFDLGWVYEAAWGGSCAGFGMVKGCDWKVFCPGRLTIVGSEAIAHVPGLAQAGLGVSPVIRGVGNPNRHSLDSS